MPFVELSYGRMRMWAEGSSMSRSFYGRTSFWSVSVGVRLGLGMPMHRMGRYGVAQDTAGIEGRPNGRDSMTTRPAILPLLLCCWLARAWRRCGTSAGPRPHPDRGVWWQRAERQRSAVALPTAADASWSPMPRAIQSRMSR